jgi:hypothetical protein
MTTSKITTYSQTPYVDDFNSVDPITNKTANEKNYLRILYKPGVSVQTRELNQMQSILQSQIDKFGRGVFKEGAAVIDGNVNFDNEISVVDLTFNNDPSEFINELNSIQSGSGLTASILTKVALGTNNLEYRFFIRYENSSNGGTSKEFSADDVINSTNAIGSVVAQNDQLGTITLIQYGALAKVSHGVFFVKGEFVFNEDRTIYLVKPSPNYLISGKIAFRVDENIVDTSTDVTLLDNASGTPNFVAPGADRYQINLEPLFISDNNEGLSDTEFVSNNDKVVNSNDVAASNKSYVALLSIIDGRVFDSVHTKLGNNINDVLAKRTSEENGNYTVEPFLLDVRDYYNDVSSSENRGMFTPDQIMSLDISVESGDISELPVGAIQNESDAITYGKSRFISSLEPSVAYVQGYRIETKERIDLSVERARKQQEGVDLFTTARLGNYLEGESISHLPTFGDEVSFDVGSVTAKVRGLEFVGGKYRLYLYDITGSIATTASTATSGSFVFNFTPASGLIDTEFSKSLFTLPYNVISQLGANNNGSGEFTVRISKSGAVQSNQITLTESNGRFFNENENSYIVVDASGNTVNISSATLGGTNNNVVVLTVAETPPLSNASPVTVMCSIKRTLSSRTKTSQQFSKSVTSLGSSFVGLDHVDVFEIVSAVVQGSPDIDITDDIVLDSGQRDSVYKTSQIRYTGSLDLSGDDVEVIYKYFERSPGDFYSISSYSATEYENVPSYNGLRLSDVLDFRPDDGDYSVSTIDPNSVVNVEVGFYLNRIDKIVVDIHGNFKVIKGIDALSPEAPSSPANAMSLYDVNVPAYTFKVRDIKNDYIDNKRYTMRDIGDLDRRIKNLEYYTSLSLLEQAAGNKQIFETSGIIPHDRFKNGILVDSFLGHNVGDSSDLGYAASIDSVDGILRPLFSENSKRLVLDSGQGDIYGGMASLEYTEETPFIEQRFASEHMSVNPYAVAAWLGDLELSPSSDEWKETSQRPDIIIDERNSQAVLAEIANASKAQGTQWSSWRVSWTGRFRNSGRGRASQSFGESRTGIRTRMVTNDVTKVVDDKVVDITVVPFIRSRKIHFSGELFRPNTKLFLFFDKINISQYATKIATHVEYKNSNSVTSYLDQTSSEVFSSESRVELVTDSNGAINGYFVIPNNSAIKFRTGEREVRLIDAEDNDPSKATTSATIKYSASGLRNHQQRTILSTRTVETVQDTVSSSRTLSRTVWRDPLAQTFMIGDIDSGLFATSIDLYFQKKAVDAPVSVYIVETENGIPTQNVVPLSQVNKNPVDVSISSTANVATNFKFSTPIYLRSEVEYALVVISNSPDYRAWVSNIGFDDVSTGEMILKNPYLGVLLKSQNASTWTPDQNKDLKFKFHRAKYPTNQVRTIDFKTLGIGTGEDSFDFSQLFPIMENIVLPDTKLELEIKTITGGTYQPMDSMEDFYASSGSSPITNDSTIKVRAKLSTTSEYVTPIIDLDRVSLIGIKNIINGVDANGNYDLIESSVDSELNANHGLAEARYITKEVELNQAADQLNTYLNINRPIDTADVKVYARFKNSENSIYNTDFEELVSNIVIPINADSSEFSEVMFSLNKGSDEFTAFQVKIVMVSNQHHKVPSVKDFRAIATI